MTVGREFMLALLTSDRSEQPRLLRTANERGITPDVFEYEDESEAYQFILDYYYRYGVLPSVALLETEREIGLPRYSSGEPFQFWLDELRKRYQLNMAAEGVEEMQEYLQEGSVQSVIECVQSLSATFNRMDDSRSVVTLHELAERVLQLHDEIQQSGEVGVPLGLPYLDGLTGGLCKSDFWAVVGRPGSGKTYFLLRGARGAHETHRKRVMVVTLEMSSDQIGMRHIAMGGRMNAKRFRMGQLSYFARQELGRYVEELRREDRDRDDFVLVSGGLSGQSNTLSWGRCCKRYSIRSSCRGYTKTMQ